MKILLLNAPFKAQHGRFSRAQRSPAITKGGTLYYPFGLCSIAGVLEADGFGVKIVDAPARRLGLAEVRRLVLEFQPRLLILDTSTPSIQSDAAVAGELGALSGAVTVLIGTHPSALPEQTLRLDPRIDAVVRREPEYAVLDLARMLRDGPSPHASEMLRDVAGLSLRLGGEIVHTPDRPYIDDLDQLPFLSRVYREHLRIRDYFYTIAQYPQVAIFSARGCPHHCAYCLYPQVLHGHRVRKRSVENLIAELQYIERHIPEVREVVIEDDTFTIDRRRLLDFTAAYRRAALSLSWIANSRADVELDVLRQLKASNCRLLCVGFESGDQAVLDKLGKRLELERAVRFARDARRVGILIHGCFLVGGPGETPHTMDRTLALAKSLPLDTAQFFPLMVYPGTQAYAWAKESGYLRTEDFSKWNTDQGLHDCVVSRPGLDSEDLVAFCNRARREFYARPGYLLYRLRRLATHPAQDGPRMWRSLRVFHRHLLRWP